MAGGQGERFWPKSTASMPKHLLGFVRKKPMISQTLERVSGLVPKKQIAIITNKKQFAKIKQNAKGVAAQNMIIEPFGRSTAAAIGLAAALLNKCYPEAVMVALPCDHVIQDKKKFARILRCASEAASKSGGLVTLGINPRFAFTGYGYIKKGAAVRSIAGERLYKVERFVEKPDKNTARKYVESGQYFWNSGIFIWKAQAILDEMKKYMPALYRSLGKIEKSCCTASFKNILEKEYKKLKDISIDYGIMEKTKKALVLATDLKWDDIGSWDAMSSYGKKDQDGNIVVGDFKGIDAKNCVVVGEKNRLVAVIGIQDAIIVESRNATLVCGKKRTQDVKALVHELKKDDRLARYTR